MARLIDRYIEQFEPFARWGRTKKADLLKLKAYDIASKDVREPTCDVLIEHVRFADVR